ncbi:MAG TPA: DNA mismatch repair endonuclease MutL [Kofleriaceae bacterium]|jgi:DNA mismatch repair protein MutL
MIAVLAPHVIDQIAAGEVIERPASVVKELADNAIDAGAGSVAIEVAAGGRALVRVSDDGCGMSAKAAVLALERHATSKLREVDDLWGIASLGFRGEALPAIASVSRMTLTTRRAGDDAATRIVVEAGRLVSVTEAGAPVGTTVEVADLLYNIPARLKFLKGEATEASHITELVAKLAMAYPRLHVRLRHNGRTALDVPPDRDGFARAQALLGPRIAARMVPVAGEESGVRVTAYLGAPELAQATARGVQLFVGRRPVRDRGLLHALAMGYGELVARGRYPVAIVLLDVPAGAVDVNVHPQKLEVRFSDAAAVAAAVRHVVQAGVAAARWRDEAGGGAPVHLVGSMASVAPPALPFDGHAATQLAERHAQQMRSRQVSLGFGPAPELAPVTDVPPVPGAARDWARRLREQTRASRAEEPRAVYQPGGPASYPGLPSLADPGAWSREAGGDAAMRGPHAADDPDGDGPLREAQRGGMDAHGSRTSDGPDCAAQAGADTDTHPSRSGDDRRDARLADAHHGLCAGEELDREAEPNRSRSWVLAAAAGAAVVDLPALPPRRFAAGTGPIAPQASSFFSQLRYLGQLDLTYLACEGDGELVLIDQHAAHERVELARLRARHARDPGEPRVAVQNMLFPVTIDATPPQLALVARVGALLAQVGFEVEPFGKATLAVKAVPAGIRHGEPAQLLRRLLRDWAEAGIPGEAELDERLDALLGEIACHSVVRAGDRLSPGEAEMLLRSLDEVDLTLPAPHGRAVLLRLPLSEIGRRFGR